MRENCRSSGVATAEAMVSGSAPGSDALTEMVGELHLRQRRHRQQLVRHRPGNDDRCREQERRNRALDERRGEVHTLHRAGFVGELFFQCGRWVDRRAVAGGVVRAVQAREIAGTGMVRGVRDRRVGGRGRTLDFRKCCEALDFHFCLPMKEQKAMKNNRDGHHGVAFAASSVRDGYVLDIESCYLARWVGCLTTIRECRLN